MEPEKERDHQANYGLYRCTGITPSTNGGYIGSRRVASLGGLKVAIAAGRGVRVCVVSRDSLTSYTPNQIAEQRKTGLVRPLASKANVSTLSQHDAEVVDISTGVLGDKALLASTDSLGTTIVTQYNDDSKMEEGPVVSFAGPQGADRSRAEAGLCSSAFAPDGKTLARTQKLQNTIEVFDVEHGGAAIRKFRPLSGPSQAVFVPSGLLAVAEGSTVAFYDARVGGTGAAAMKMESVAGTSALHSITWAPRMNWLLAAGDDRCVSAIDVTAGGIVARWPACTQLTTCGVFPSMASECERRCYAIGSNSQVVSGIISKKRDRTTVAEDSSSTTSTLLHSLRVDSRWLGATLATATSESREEDGDVLIGFTAASSLYILRNAEQLLAATVAQDDSGNE